MNRNEPPEDTPVDEYSAVYDLRITKVAQAANCSPETINFIFRAHPPVDAMAIEMFHVDAAEFCWRLHDQAILEFGETARSQLKSWGIESTDDFGRVVYEMIDQGLMLKNDDDELEDFHDVFEFKNAFLELRYPATSKPTQWNLSSMFVVTTIAAIALSGAMNWGFSGAVGTLFAAWFMLVGGFCVASGIRENSKGRVLALTLGVLLIVMGVLVFLAIASIEP